MRAVLKHTVILAPHLQPKPKEARPDPAPPPPVYVRVLPSFTRRVRAYAATGLLVQTTERHARRDACAGCEFHEGTGHAGLYRCTHRSCGCGGGDELRMVMPASTCPHPDGSRWPQPTDGGSA